MACHDNDDRASHVKIPTTSSFTWHEKTTTEVIVFSWWVGKGSNLRRREPGDLQSPPFDHFGTDPGADNRIRTDDLLFTKQLL